MEKMYRDFTLCENCGERCYLGNKLCEDCANDEVDRWVTHKQVDCNTIQEQSDLIEDLKVKLAESEKSKEINIKERDKICLEMATDYNRQIYKLKQQLAEKETRIAELEDKDWYEETIKQLEEQNERLIEKRDQDKISFAVEQLEKVRELVEEKGAISSPFGNLKIQASDVSVIIDNQIKAIKGDK